LRSTEIEANGKPGTLLDDQLTVACGNRSVRILELQRAGAKAMKADEFLRGAAIARGTVLA
jgi:methionyl-tRNA formyltransferase